MSEEMGKILGMAMAYGVSSLGLFLAYVNYRKRVVKADKVMSSGAWAVLAAVFLAVAAGVAVVWQLAEPPAPVAAEAAAEVAREVAAPATPAPATAGEEAERDRWPLIGILIPAVIFLFATWVTTSLHRHFTSHGHGDPSPP